MILLFPLSNSIQIFKILLFLVVSHLLFHGCNSVKKGSSDTELDMENLELEGYLPERVLLKLLEPLDARKIALNSKQTNYGDIVIDAMKRTMPGAHLYMIDAGSIEIDRKLQNTVLEADILRSFPVGGKLVRMRLKGAVMTQLENIALKQNRGSAGYCQIFRRPNISFKPVQTYEIVIPEWMALGKVENMSFLKDFDYFNDDIQFFVEGKTIRNDLRDILIFHLLKSRQF